MKYEKPKIIAKNLPSGSYAAGCPAKETIDSSCMIFSSAKHCKDCERSK